MMPPSNAYVDSFAGRLGKALTRHVPLIGFLGQAALAFTYLLLRGSFKPYVEADSGLYIELSQTGFFQSSVLRSIRTLGYPLFLKLITAFSADPRAVPIAQFLIFNLALALFYSGLRKSGGSRFFSVGITGYLAAVVYTQGTFSPDNFQPGIFYFSRILTESLSVSLCIAFTGVLLRCFRRGGEAAFSPAFGAGAVVLLFSCYQVRPANLFLVLLAPLWSGIFLRLQRGKVFFRRLFPSLLPVVLGAALLPLLLFCTLRWLVVGQFGLVSFGGHNLVGITGQLLSPEMASDLPIDIQPFAKAILERREKFGFTSPVRGKYGIYCRQLESFFDIMQWQIADPAAVALYGNDMVTVNRMMSRFSLAVLTRMPGVYLAWVAKTLGASFTMAMSSPAFLVPSIALLILVTILVAGKLGPVTELPQLAGFFSADDGVVFQSLWVIAVTFFTVQMGLIVLVQEPLPRYVFTSGYFLPLLPFGGFLRVFQLLRQPHQTLRAASTGDWRVKSTARS